MKIQIFFSFYLFFFFFFFWGGGGSGRGGGFDQGMGWGEVSKVWGRWVMWGMGDVNHE